MLSLHWWERSNVVTVVPSCQPSDPPEIVPHQRLSVFGWWQRWLGEEAAHSSLASFLLFWPKLFSHNHAFSHLLPSRGNKTMSYLIAGKSPQYCSCSLLGDASILPLVK